MGAQKRELAIRFLVNERLGFAEKLQLLSDDELVGMAAPCLPQVASGAERSGQLTVTRTPTTELIQSAEEVGTEENWAVATAEAKDGAVEAARRENICWRQWHRKTSKDRQDNAEATSDG